MTYQQRSAEGCIVRYSHQMTAIMGKNTLREWRIIVLLVNAPAMHFNEKYGTNIPVHVNIHEQCWEVAYERKLD